MHVVVAGGGTTGHVLPAVPVIERLREQGDTVLFVGTNSGLEEELVKPLGIEFAGIAAGKLRRYWSLENVTDVFKIVAGVFQSIWLLLRRRPGVVFSKGGYVSFPVSFAAWLLRIPVVAHESDFSPGLANRLVMPFARVLCTSFAETRVASGRLRVVHTGTPVRKELIQGERARGRSLSGATDDTPLLVVTGGSLGADRLNAAVRDALPELLQIWHVFHACGAGKKVASTEDRYRQEEYVGEGWGDILAAADIVISRAGANALFELLTLRKPTLLVPLPATSSRGDQLENASYARENGYALVIEEEDLDTRSMIAALEKLDTERDKYGQALAGFQRQDSAEMIETVLREAAST